MNLTIEVSLLNSASRPSKNAAATRLVEMGFSELTNSCIVTAGGKGLEQNLSTGVRITIVMKSLEYLAGLFDGEGSVSIGVKVHESRNVRRPFHFLIVGLGCYGMEHLLPELKKRFGGVIITRKSRRSFPYWRATSLKAYRFLKAIIPYLEVKKDVALLAIKFYEERVVGHKSKQVPKEEIWRREMLRREIHKLNSKRGQRGKQFVECNVDEFF